MGKIENSLLYQMFVLGGASSGGGGVTTQALSVTENGTYTAPTGKAYTPVTVNVPEKENPYLPDAADGYTEYADIAELTVSDIRNCGIGSTLNAKIALNTGIAVGDKVLLTGRILNSGSDVVLYAVWGTANYYHNYSTYARVRFVVSGSSIRPFTGDTVSIDSNGVTNVFGASKVDVNVESVQTEPLYVNENGDYYPESGYAYGEVHVDVQGGSEPNLQSKAVTVTQNGTQTIEPDSGYDGLSDVALTVNVSGGGTVEAEEKDVNFIDYDGTILYSYTADEFLNLAALPANPSHAGLTAQGWNWNLSEAQTYVDTYGTLWIGQMYITDDGKTRLYIHLDAEDDLSPTLHFEQSSKGAVTVDWGDGNTDTDTSSTSAVLSHTYATKGDYIIELSSGLVSLGGASDIAAGVYNGGCLSDTHMHILTKVELGSVTAIQTSRSVFQNAVNLKSVTIPSGISFTYCSRAFYTCYDLRGLVFPVTNNLDLCDYVLSNSGVQRVSLPNNVSETTPYNSVFYYSQLTALTLPSGLTTNIMQSYFYNNVRLRKVVLPMGITTIGKTAFFGCVGLRKLVVPSTVTSIAEQAFSGVDGIKEYHFKSTTPPTLANTNAFNGIPADAIIYVPYHPLHVTLSNYKHATNWSTYASHMQEEPQ